MVVTSASITAPSASTRKPICRLKLPALAQLNSTSVGPAPASCCASTAKLSTAAAPTQLISSSATGLRNRFTVRLKVINPRPTRQAPARGNTGISQASSAGEGIRL